MIRDELRGLMKNKLLLFVMIVILLIPAIYAGMFLSSMWDPYGEISKLPVAVVNKDVAVAYNGKTLSVGENLVSSLKSNDAMDFHITDEVTAANGLKDGKYYMIITIPENFSKNASSVMDANPEKMQLEYTTNPGYNYISSKLSESAIKEIKANIIAEVTTTYTNALFDSIAELGDGYSQAADGTSELLTGMNILSDGALTITDNLNLLADSSVALKDGSATLGEGVSAYVDGVSQVDGGISSLADGTDKLAKGAKELQTGSKALLSGANKMKKQLDKSLTSDKVSQINTASDSLITMNDSIQKLNTAVNGDGTEENKGIDISGIGLSAQTAGKSLQSAGSDLNEAASDLVGGYAATGKRIADLRTAACSGIRYTFACIFQSNGITACRNAERSIRTRHSVDSGNITDKYRN